LLFPPDFLLRLTDWTVVFFLTAFSVWTLPIWTFYRASVSRCSSALWLAFSMALDGALCVDTVVVVKVAEHGWVLIDHRRELGWLVRLSLFNESDRAKPALDWWVHLILKFSC
jgi:hypothetical protein